MLHGFIKMQSFKIHVLKARFVHQFKKSYNGGVKNLFTLYRLIGLANGSLILTDINRDKGMVFEREHSEAL